MRCAPAYFIQIICVIFSNVFLLSGNGFKLVIVHDMSLFLVCQAQEEMAWKIAKMIVNDVMQQGHQGSPEVKATKVHLIVSLHS